MSRWYTEDNRRTNRHDEIIYRYLRQYTTIIA